MAAGRTSAPISAAQRAPSGNHCRGSQGQQQENCCSESAIQHPATHSHAPAVSTSTTPHQPHLVPADEHTNVCVPRLEHLEPGVPGAKVKLFLVCGRELGGG